MCGSGGLNPPGTRIERGTPALRRGTLGTVADEEQFCTEFAREHRHLGVVLADRRRWVRALAERLSDEDLLEDSLSALVERVLEDPSGGQEPVARPGEVSCEPELPKQNLAEAVELRGEDSEESIMCWRWRLLFRWTGPRDHFGKWPEQAVGLATYDNHPNFGSPPTIKWHLQDDLLTASLYVPRSDGALDDGRAEWPRDLVQEALNHIEAYCVAVNQQVASWEEETEDWLTHWLTERQALVRRGRDSRQRMQVDLLKWRVEPLRAKRTPTQPPKDADDGGGNRAPSPEVTVLPSLEAASFGSVVLVLNRWIDAIERYSAAFVGLEEERLADLAVATLNGAFGRAGREVFIGGGKSDLYVESSAVGLDGNAFVLAGEAKFWDGQQSILDAVDQSLNNLTQRSTSALLIVFVRERVSFSTARETALNALTNDERCLRVDPEVNGRPHLVMRSTLDPEAEVSLCVMVVDLTREPSQQPKAKGASKRVADEP